MGVKDLNRGTIALTAVVTLGGFLFGYDTGVVSGAMLEIKEAGSGLSDTALSAWTQEMIVSSAVGSAALGSASSGLLQRCRHCGRRTVSMWGAVFFTIGAFVMAFAKSITTMIIGRILVGFAVGVASQAVPVYIAEAVSAEHRGMLVAWNNTIVVVGQVISSVVCCKYASDDLYAKQIQGWRWMLGWGAFPGMLMFIGLFAVPESPRWLLKVRKDESAAFAALEWLRGSHDVAETELESIKKHIEEERLQEGTAPFSQDGETLWQRLCRRRVLKALILGVGLQLLQQSVGINTIMYYSATIVQMSSHGASCHPSAEKKYAMTAGDVRDVCLTIPIATCQLVGTLVAVFFADKAGRRVLLLSSLFGISISLAFLGYAFYPEVCIEWIAMAGMCIYLITFGIGMSPMAWVVNAEIYPLDVRSVANSIATTANWISNYLVSATFLTLGIALSTSQDCPVQHPDGAFWLYGSIALTGFVLVYRGMPETSNKTLEEIDALFE